MKHMVVAVVCVVGGFLAASILYWNLARGPAQHFAAFAAAPRPSAASARASVAAPSLLDIKAANGPFEQQHLAWQLAAASDLGVLKSVINRCLGQDWCRDDPGIVAIFVARFVELDPKGAFSFVNADSRMDRAYFTYVVIANWARYDAASALDALLAIKSPVVRGKVEVRLLADATFARSAMAARIEKEMGPVGERMRDMFAPQPGGPAQAFRDASYLTGKERRYRMQSAVMEWALQDPKAALDAVDALSDAIERERMLRAAVRGFAERDPKAAFDWLSLNRPDDTRSQKIALEAYVRHDLNAALPVVEDFVRRTGQTDLEGFVASLWARRDPARALAWVDTQDEDVKGKLYESLGESYVYSKPEKAIAWLSSLDAKYGGTKFVVAVNYAANNSSRAQDLLDSTTDPTVRGAMIRGIAQAKADVDPQAALKWLSQYNGEDGLVHAYRTVIQAYAREDPVAAARSLDPTLPDNIVSEETEFIAREWRRHDPEAALRWAQSLQSKAAHDSAMQSVLEQFAYKNPDRDLSLAASLGTQARQHIALDLVMFHPKMVEDVITRLDITGEFAEKLRRRAAEQGQG